MACGLFWLACCSFSHVPLCDLFARRHTDEYLQSDNPGTTAPGYFDHVTLSVTDTPIHVIPDCLGMEGGRHLDTGIFGGSLNP
jgi:hypothetical protein